MGLRRSSCLDHLGARVVEIQPMHRPTSNETRHPIIHSAVQRFVTNYEWIHTGIGLLGNTAFLVGSVFFLFESLKRAGTWLFIAGSFGMLLGSLGRAIVEATGVSNTS